VSNQLILAVDQGTGSTKGLLFNSQLQPVASATENIGQASPNPGWVEQDPIEILASVEKVIAELAAAVRPDSGGPTELIAGLALTNQRESAMAWDPKTGQPLSALLGWQDRRTASAVARYNPETQAMVRKISGLPLDPMFSALKFAWILDQIDPDRSKSRAGQIALGTVDSWLVFKLTGKHQIEVGNASRTQLLDIERAAWSPKLHTLFNIPVEALPQVVASDDDTAIITSGPLAGKPILAVLADSHAALYAHGSTAKATFGTGSSIMARTDAPTDHPGLVNTIAWAVAGQGFGTMHPGESDHGTTARITTAVEGNILSSGSTLIWLGGLLNQTTHDLAALAPTASTDPRHALNLVPAFGGLGAPWWSTSATAQLTGMTLGSGIAELAKAAFDSVVLQINDVLKVIDEIRGEPLTRISVDGGPTSNEWLMQLMADLSQRIVVRADIHELSALGVAAFAGTHSGIWQNTPAATNTSFAPKLSAAAAYERRTSWDAAVADSLKTSN